MSQELGLVQPSFALCDSYRSLVAEVTAAGEKFVPFVLAFEHDDFAAFLTRLDRCARGIDLPNGFVAHSTYWLVLGQGEVVGVSNIRHTLTAALRREVATLVMEFDQARDGEALAPQYCESPWIKRPRWG